jgi:hypothetical protein
MMLPSVLLARLSLRVPGLDTDVVCRAWRAAPA